MSIKPSNDFRNKLFRGFKKKDVFALTVNGDSMIDACIAHGDMVLMEKVTSISSLHNGDIVSALVSGLGTTLKYFFKFSDNLSSKN